jgi:hypothetical protein
VIPASCPNHLFGSAKIRIFAACNLPPCAIWHPSLLKQATNGHRPSCRNICNPDRPHGPCCDSVGSSREADYASLVDFFTKAVLYHEHIPDTVTIGWKYFGDNELWNAKFATLGAFEEDFAHTTELKRIVDPNSVSRSRKRINERVEKIESRWGSLQECPLNDLLPASISYHLLGNLSELAQSVPLARGSQIVLFGTIWQLQELDFLFRRWYPRRFTVDFVGPVIYPPAGPPRIFLYDGLLE